MRAVSIVTLSVLAALIGCSDDASSSHGNKSGDGGVEGTGKIVTQKITAAKGGTVTASGATFKFPAGALTKDLEITVANVSTTGLPDSDSIASAVYELGPDDTQFKKPVTLTLDFAGKAPKGSLAVIAYLDESTDEWVGLADSAADGQSATATTLHFTKFAVVFLDGVQVAGQCLGMDVSCGGDLVGTWKFSAGCATVDAKDLVGGQTSPLYTCKGLGASVSVDLSGTISFKADDTYKTHMITDFSYELSVPKTCVSNKCGTLSQQDGGVDVVAKGDNCVQSGDPASETNDEVGTYTVKDNTLVTTPDADGGSMDAPAEFCVKGDTLTAKITTGSGSIVYYTATRQ